MTHAVKHYLGIDYGHVRIGLAVADSVGKLARPLRTLQKSQDPVAAIDEIIQEQQTTAIILGLPRNLDGDDTVQTLAVRKFGEALQTLGLPVHLQDEAGTSSLAREQLQAAGNKSRDKGLIDQQAATIILQDWLNQ